MVIHTLSLIAFVFSHLQHIVDSNSPLRAPLCSAASGICTISSRCKVPFHNATLTIECTFSDGPGVCCPAPAIGKGSRFSCASAGGVCAPIAGCFLVGGELAAGRCTPKETGYACCVPGARCANARKYRCCDNSTSFRPICDRGGELRCPITGTELRLVSECP